MSEIKGLDKLLVKLEALGLDSNKALETGIKQAAKKVQGDAKLICPSNNGQLRNSIKASTETADNKIVGKVSTNNEYAAYVEFGTGPVGEHSPKDLPPDIASKIHYKADRWFIPADKIDEATAEKYRFKKIKVGDKEFYISYGQPAKPYLYPALKQNEKKVKEIIAEHLKKTIEKVAKE